MGDNLLPEPFLMTENDAQKIFPRFVGLLVCFACGLWKISHFSYCPLVCLCEQSGLQLSSRCRGLGCLRCSHLSPHYSSAQCTTVLSSLRDRYSSKVSPPSPHLYVSGIAPYSDAPTALGSSVFGEHYSFVARPNAPRLRPLQQLLPNSAAAPWLHPLQQLLPVCIHFSCRMKWFPIWLHFWSHTCTCKV